jgi:hypothetical protein
MGGNGYATYKQENVQQSQYYIYVICLSEC